MYLVSPPLPFFPVGAVLFLPKPGGGDPEEEDAAAEHRTLSLCAKRQAPPPRVAAAARIIMAHHRPLPASFELRWRAGPYRLSVCVWKMW